MSLKDAYDNVKVPKMVDFTFENACVAAKEIDPGAEVVKDGDNVIIKTSELHEFIHHFQHIFLVRLRFAVIDGGLRVSPIKIA